MFAPWAAALPDEVELLAVQLPGRETRLDEPLRHAMEEVAPPLAEALAPWLDLPYAMFGHSTGAPAPLRRPSRRACRGTARSGSRAAPPRGSGRSRTPRRRRGCAAAADRAAPDRRGSPRG
ncbi:thioesterase domain-containing protein, partial [Burkholderia gladioli]|nr:thioesterase domain-containing protein [Burkholderia gladioli]